MVYNGVIMINSILLGTFSPKLDDKGRLILPAKFREIFGQKMVITRGQERCLYLLPVNQFERIYSQIEKTPLENKRSRDYLRLFLSGAEDQAIDRQGRVLISQTLRAYAELNRELVVIGAGSRAELWSKENWEKYLESKLEDYSELDFEAKDE